jgi:hypothetical protein
LFKLQLKELSEKIVCTRKKTERQRKSEWYIFIPEELTNDGERNE